MKTKSAWVIVLIFVVAIVVVLKSDKFSLMISGGVAKMEMKGEQQAAHDDSQHPKVLSSEKNTTEGNQSPVVNNVGGTSVINYVNK